MLAVISSTAEATTLDVGRHLLGGSGHVFMLVDISSAAAATVFDWLVVSSAPLASCVAVAVARATNWPRRRCCS